MVGFRDQRGSGVRRYTDGQCTTRLSGPERRNREGRLAAGGHGDQHIFRADAQFDDPRSGCIRSILSVLHRAQQRLLAASDHKRHAIRGPTECRQEFRAVLHRYSRGGSSTGID